MKDEGGEKKLVCYIIPLTAAAVVFLTRRVSRKARDSTRVFWLNLMLVGAAVALVVDHVWNNELFLVGKNIASDLALGVAMTAFVAIAWAIVAIVEASKARATTGARARW